jgi:hypothetical protein
MRTGVRLNWVTMCMVLALTIMILGGGLVLSFLLGFNSYPSNETMARRYLDAVQRQDLERAVELAGPGCAALVRETAQADIATYGGAEVRDVDIQAQPGTGSDDKIRFVTLTFEYRRAGVTDWQAGRLRILTDYDPPGFRYVTCGG